MYPLVGDVDSGGGLLVGRGWVYGNSVLSAQFCCETKSALRNKVNKKKNSRDIFGRRDKLGIWD